MKSFSNSKLREEMMVFAGAIKELNEDNEKQIIAEKFLKASDPTISVGIFIDEVSKNLSSIDKLYKEKARDRNEIVKPVLDEVNEIMGVCVQLKKALSGAKESPEDNNKSV